MWLATTPFQRLVICAGVVKLTVQVLRPPWPAFTSILPTKPAPQLSPTL